MASDNVERLSVGTSGWSYPSWRPGFYPAGLAPEEFLSFYAERLPSVELNSTGYRLPSEEQFGRWAAQVPEPSWDDADVAPAVRVNDWEAEAPFRYLRFREPPYTDTELQALAGRIRPLVATGVEVFAYFRHEDEPDAPVYANRLLQLVHA